MRVALPAESAPHERRVALAPESVGRLIKAGAELRVQRGAGELAGFPTPRTRPRAPCSKTTRARCSAAPRSW